MGKEAWVLTETESRLLLVLVERIATTVERLHVEVVNWRRETNEGDEGCRVGEQCPLNCGSRDSDGICRLDG